jgi:uncharacterized protein YcnI
MNSLAVRILTVATVLTASASMALGHVNFEKRSAKADANYKAVMTVTHGCEGSPTLTFRVKIPAGVFNVKPMPKPGWTIKLIEGDYEKPQIYHGKTHKSGVTEIVWSGGSLPHNFYDEFVFRARIGAFEAPTKLYFPAVQECEKGQNAWVEVPADGKSRRDLEHPAPVLQVNPANDSGEHKH